MGLTLVFAESADASGGRFLGKMKQRHLCGLGG
ncbi:MAG: hypothetical protein ACI83E_002082, partial [Sulfitobacter sp.]